MDVYWFKFYLQHSVGKSANKYPILDSSAYPSPAEQDVRSDHLSVRSYTLGNSPSDPWEVWIPSQLEPHLSHMAEDKFVTSQAQVPLL